MAGKKRKYAIARALADEGRTNEAGLHEWRLRWTDPETGQRKSESIGYRTAEEAAEEAETKTAALRVGVLLPSNTSEGATVDDLVAHYLTDIEGRGSLKYQRDELRRCKRLGKVLGRLAPDRVTQAHLRAYALARSRETTRLKRPPKRNYIREDLHTLRRVFKLARDSRLITCDAPSLPSFKFLPEDARPARRLTEDEVTTLINAGYAHSNAMGTLIEVLAWSGRREIAVFALTRGDCGRLVDGTPRAEAFAHFARDKGGVSTGWGPLTDPAYQAIRNRLAVLGDVPPETLLWTSPSGIQWHCVLFHQQFMPLAEAATSITYRKPRLALVESDHE